MTSTSAPMKLVFLGDGRVGKTSLVSRFVENKFSEVEPSTVKAKMFIKKRVMIGTRPVELAIWDTAGQERYQALGPLYYRNASAAVLVYDITDEDSFNRVKTWIKELKKNVGDQLAMVICGNKSDLEKDRVVEQMKAEKFARKQNADHLGTSARLGAGVEEAFTAVIRRALLQADEAASLGDDYGLGADMLALSSPTVNESDKNSHAAATKRGRIAVDMENENEYSSNGQHGSQQEHKDTTGMDGLGIGISGLGYESSLGYGSGLSDPSNDNVSTNIEANGGASLLSAVMENSVAEKSAERESIVQRPEVQREPSVKASPASSSKIHQRPETKLPRAKQSAKVDFSASGKDKSRQKKPGKCSC